MKANKQHIITTKYDSNNTVSVSLNNALVEQIKTPVEIFNLFKENLKLETQKWHMDSSASSITSTNSRRRMSVKVIIYIY